MAFGAFYLRDTVGSPERARWLHLAHAGSQSQRAIWFILPARGAGYLINIETYSRDWTSFASPVFVRASHRVPDVVLWVCLAG